ncbi:MAG: hypothetical protein ACJASQ_001666 [Crocinitomicaceae bacterium]|jgi:hypothetical protein
MKVLVFLSAIIIGFGSYSQTVTLPVNFEGGSVVNGDFTNFDGGTGTVIVNPQSGGINTSATVGQMVRNGGQVWAGAYLTTATNVDFSADPYICMLVWTTAPIGTQVSLKMEGCGGGCFQEEDAFTTVTGEWEALFFDFSGAPAIYNRLVFLFDLGNLGNGSAASTFLFDDVKQLTNLPLSFTPGSQYFCPDDILTMTYPGTGLYNWYDAPTGGTLVEAGSSTYVTSLLTADSTWYVQDMTPTTIPATDVGPTLKGASDPTSGPASVFFTSNLNNGFWYSVDIVEKIVGGGPPPYTCQYTVTGLNLTQATSQSLTWNHVGATDNSQWTYNFPSPVPMDLNDNMELRVTVSGDVGCYISSHHSGGDIITSFPTTTSGGELVFTGHTPNANQWMGFDYNVSGDYIDPTRFQVNAIVDCAIFLPIELMEFYVTPENGNALLNWVTASELRNDYFLLERTSNGVDYETIGKVDGAGTSTGLNAYSFLDTNPISGISYYRLTQVDFDGASTTSWTVVFSKDELLEFSLSPNPTSGVFTVTTTLSHEQDLVIEIRDLLGRVIESDVILDANGAVLKTYSIEEYPSGLYSVLVRTANKTKLMKLVKP